MRDAISFGNHCCKSGCPDCPYELPQTLDPSIPQELVDPWQKEGEEVPLEDEALG